MQGEDVAANQASSVWVRVQLVQADEKIQTMTSLTVTRNRGNEVTTKNRVQTIIDLQICGAECSIDLLETRLAHSVH